MSDIQNDDGLHMPVLTTPRLLIRALQPADHDACQALFRAIGWFDATRSDADIAYRRRSWFEWAVANSRELARLYQPPLGDRAIIDRASGEFVGLVGYVPSLEPFAQLPSFGRVRQARNTVEIGLFWAVMPEWQGRGIASEAAAAMVENAFERLRLQRIVATTETGNPASQAVMRRIGMTVEQNPFPEPPHYQTVGWIDAGTPYIRDERPADAAAIDAVVTAAFGPEASNAAFVAVVREQADVCLADVAVVDGVIVGHAQWCAAPIVVDGKTVKAAYLACLSVEPAWQRRGVGSRLVRGGLARLRERGCEAATLLGDPAYYGRFGFSPALAQRIEAPHRVRGVGFQAIELVAGALDGTAVRGDFPAVIAPG